MQLLIKYFNKIKYWLLIFLSITNLVYPSFAFSGSVNVASGEHTQPFDLFEINGNNYANYFTITYRSMDYGDAYIKHGWRHAFTITLAVPEYTDGSMIVFTERDREEYVFKYVNGKYKPVENNTSLIQTNDKGYLVTIKDRKYFFNKDNKIVKYIGPNNDWLDFSYKNGAIVSVEDNLYNIVTLSYSQNKVSEIISPEGKIFKLKYINNNLSDLVFPDGSGYKFSYDDQNYMLSKTDRDNLITNYYYDNEHRVIRSLDSNGNAYDVNYPTINTDVKTSSYVDKKGVVHHVTSSIASSDIKTTSYIDKEGLSWGYTYDTHSGNLLKKVDPQGGATLYTYDDYGHKLSETNPLGQTTNYSYDAAGNLLGVKDSENNTFSYEYDSRGNIITLTNSKETIHYKYNSANKMTAIIEPYGRITRMKYDFNGNLIQETDPEGAIMSYKYNNKNQLIEVVDPIGNHHFSDEHH